MTQAQPQRSTSDLVKAAVSGWLGTALEFMDFQRYDWYVYDIHRYYAAGLLLWGIVGAKSLNFELNNAIWSRLFSSIHFP